MTSEALNITSFCGGGNKFETCWLVFCMCYCVRVWEGLKEGDRIIEVNGVNVEGDFHAECAAKVQSVVGQVKLLVVDSVSDAFFKQHRMRLSSKEPYVSRHACPNKSLPGPVWRSSLLFQYSLFIRAFMRKSFVIIIFSALNLCCIDWVSEVNPAD